MKNRVGNGLMTKDVSDEERRLAWGQRDAFARNIDQLAASQLVYHLARLGYAAEGLLYVIVGGTAALATVEVGGRVRGMGGALDLIVAQPFGRLVVALVAAGLCGYILRR